ncbi:MAG: gliding motility-associated C-terminal domain-containing protein [Cytophagaceae bacterium]
MKTFLPVVFLLIIIITTVSPDVNGQYCIPAYHNICAENIYNISYIDDFTLNNLSNKGSGCNGNANNYINYDKALFTTTLEQGGTYEIMIKCKSEKVVRLYFDFNKDFDFRDPGEFFDVGYAPSDQPHYFKITIPSGISGDIRMRVRAGDFSTASTDDCNKMYWGETEDYTVTVISPFNMEYLRTELFQIKESVFPGSESQKVLAVAVETQGRNVPLTITQLNFSPEGTSSLENIKNARLYYTGTDREFSIENSFGEVVEIPSGDFSFEGNLQLEQGKNFFWLAYDVTENDEALDNYIDGICHSVIVSAETYIPENPNPAGARIIYDSIYIRNGSAVVGNKYFYDDGGPDGSPSRTTYVFTVFPKYIGTKVQVEFTQLDLCSESGCDFLEIHNGNSLSAPVLGRFYNSNPGTITSTASDGSLTFHFQLSPDMPASIDDGWKARFRNVIVNIPTAVISGGGTIKEGETAEIRIDLTGVAPFSVTLTKGSVSEVLNINSTVFTRVVSDAGIYSITKIIDANGVEGNFNGVAVVSLYEKAHAVISGSKTISQGETAFIKIEITGVAPFTLNFSNGSSTETLIINSTTYYKSVNLPGTYVITGLKDANDVEGTFTGSAVITLQQNYHLIAPEGFSPNGDSYNDYFVVLGVNPSNPISLYVYTRDGGLVFSSEDYKNQWDGNNLDGTLLSDGTYYYVITTKDKSTTIKSFVEIRR